MRTFELILLLLLTCSLTLSGASKQKGSTTLKDLQPAGTTDKKQKNQIYDFLFTTDGNNYTCRTSYDTKLKATDYVVGDAVRFEIDGDKAKLKNASGKEVKCRIVRVEKATSSPN